MDDVSDHRLEDDLHDADGGHPEPVIALTAQPPAASVAPPPTREAYSELQQAYDHFNATLFEGKLPLCLITLQRKKRTFGYFSGIRIPVWDEGRLSRPAPFPKPDSTVGSSIDLLN